VTTSPSDYLHGAKAIGDYIGVSPRRAFYLCERRLIPHGRIGSMLIATRSGLDAHFAASIEPASAKQLHVAHRLIEEIREPEPAEELIDHGDGIGDG